MARGCGIYLSARNEQEKGRGVRVKGALVGTSHEASLSSGGRLVLPVGLLCDLRHQGLGEYSQRSTTDTFLWEVHCLGSPKLGLTWASAFCV